MVLRELPDVVTTRPLGSVLIFSKFTATILDEETMRAIKESAVFDKPYVKKCAWIGSENFLKGVADNLVPSHVANFPRSRTRREALAWLAKD
jgi:hypothetical protein